MYMPLGSGTRRNSAVDTPQRSTCAVSASPSSSSPIRASSPTDAPAAAAAAAAFNASPENDRVRRSEPRRGPSAESSTSTSPTTSTS